MKAFLLTTSLFGLLLIGSTTVLADTIVLKDGRVIKCDTVREDGNIVRYWIGEASLTISKDKVERIERDNQKGDALSPSTRASITEDNKTSSTTESSKLKASPIKRPIIRTINGNFNIEAAEKLEAELKSNPQDKAKIEELVSILNVIAFQESQAGNIAKAKELLSRALNYQPSNLDSLIGLTNLELGEGRYTEALGHANKAVSVEPKNQLAYYYLGMAYYNLEDLPRAVDSWKAGLRLGQEVVMQTALAKAEKELARANDFSSGKNRFFNVVLEGGSANLGLESQLLVLLEESHTRLRRQFNFEPKERISAIFYTQQTFSDITRAPSWAGALNDGKLRVPIGGLTGVNAELAKTITHELAHSFVYFKSRGKCPTWLNEGLAQLMEGDLASSYRRELATIILNNPSLNLKALSGSFIRFTPEQARVAYIYSLAAVELLSEPSVNTAISILEDLSQNIDIDTSISKHTRYKDLKAFEAELNRRFTQ
ncbi:MAG: hypothetical protein HY819_20230 [Acidobacteria bacterium]|nr:hypothetical protein [Acidobacteriota bacterium]